jgi:hypothetical protein
MYEARLITACIEICALGGSATAVGLDIDSSDHVIARSSVSFPRLVATLGVTHLIPR